MIKLILSILGVILLLVSIFILKAGEYPTSGLMLLTVGIIMLIVAVALKYRKPKSKSV